MGKSRASSAKPWFTGMMSTRAATVMAAWPEVRSLRDLAAKTVWEARCRRGLGIGTLNELRDLLKKHGLAFRRHPLWDAPRPGYRNRQSPTEILS